MPESLKPGQITGKDESHLVTLPDGHRLQGDAAAAFNLLRAEAAEAGFALRIASSFRSFDRQLAIWNGKVAGERPVHDDTGRPVDIRALAPREKLHAILRYSAIPGTSRHHWGTDLDVYDAAAVVDDYSVQLTPDEVSPGGPFHALHIWLDEKMAAGQSHGFYRPYAQDRGGVAPERWHLSFAPIAQGCATQCDCEVLQACWQDVDLLLREEIESDLPALLARYVDVPRDWCT